MKKLLYAVCTFAAASAAADVLDYVDPFIGTAGTGHTHPAASCAFGMVQAGPDTGYGDWMYCSGYQHKDTAVYGYSQNHLSGTGCPDLGDIQLLPFTGELGALPAKRNIDKRTEKASPGYYSVTQPDDGLKIEITPTKHAAIYRVTSAKPNKIGLLVNLASIIEAGWGKFYTERAEVTVNEKDGCISGKLLRQGWIRERPIYFALRCREQWASVQGIPSTGNAQTLHYLLQFSDVAEVSFKVALSFNSVEGAQKNLDAELASWDFDAVHNAARDDWRKLLERSTAQGTCEQLTNWYTALYHLYLQPNNYADVGEEPYFTTLSLWDTFRAAHPWYTIVVPEIVTPCINSMMKLARTSGKLPVMSYGGKYMECMIGNHSLPVIADAYLKGFRGFDARAALAWMTNSVTVNHAGRSKENWDMYDKYGYYPFDLIKGESVSRTLECCYNDWCVAQMAKALGEQEIAEKFARRSEYWRNVFDASLGFVRGKDTKGNWREPFNPFALGHAEDTANDFTEGNAFHYTWFVPHNPRGLIEAMGGAEKFATKLDALFKQPQTVAGAGFVSDVSGLIGQYAHGNEPSHHVIYFFQFVNRADLAAEYIRKVFDTQYSLRADGLCGNDDCGQMSAWYLFSAMGFYPFNPCGGEYVIGAPQIPEARLTLANGKRFTMRAVNLSTENKYVKSVKLNGRKLDGFIIRHEQIMAGGELVFEMYNGASK